MQRDWWDSPGCLVLVYRHTYHLLFFPVFEHRFAPSPLTLPILRRNLTPPWIQGDSSCVDGGPARIRTRDHQVSHMWFIHTRSGEFDEAFKAFQGRRRLMSGLLQLRRYHSWNLNGKRLFSLAPSRRSACRAGFSSQCWHPCLRKWAWVREGERLFVARLTELANERIAPAEEHLEVVFAFPCLLST